jgi:hypothetical protein
VLHAPLDVLDHVAGLPLVPAPVEVFGNAAKLNRQIVGEVFRFDFAAFLSPQANQRCFVGPHNDPGVRTADEGATIFRVELEEMQRCYAALLHVIHGNHLGQSGDVRRSASAPPKHMARRGWISRRVCSLTKLLTLRLRRNASPF